MKAEPILILLCGRSFAGKSTVAAVLAPLQDARVVSLDAINAERGLSGGQGMPVQEWADTNRIGRERTRALLDDGLSVIVDDTASIRFLRDAWREVAAAAGSSFALVWLQIDPDLQQRRVEQNRGRPERPDVVDDVLRAHVDSFESPGNDEDPYVLDASEELESQARRLRFIRRRTE